MKNIHELLKEIGLEIPTDKKADFDKTIAENYKTVAEVDKINAKLTKATDELKTIQDDHKALQDQIGTLDVEGKDNEINALKSQIKKWEDKEQQRIDEEKQAQLETAYSEEWAKSIIIDGNPFPFANKETETVLYSEFKQLRADPANSAKGGADLFKQLITNREGIAKSNVTINTTGGANMPPMGAKYSLDDVKKMTPQEINKNWADVKDVLSAQK